MSDSIDAQAGQAIEQSNPQPSLEQASGADEIVSALDSGIQLEGENADGNIKEAIAEAEKEMKRKFKLKVDGEEFEEELDFSDEEGIKQKLQLARVAQKRMQEKAMLEKDVNAFLELTRDNPIEAMGRLGVNFDELAEQYVNQKLEEMEKSPEQLAQEKQIKELEELKAEAKRLKEEKESTEMQRLQEKYVTEIDNDIDQALSSSDFKLPKSPYVVKRMAETMMLAMEKGFNEVKANDVLPIVEKQFHSDFQEMFGRLPEEVVEQMIGKKTVDRLRKHRLSKAKNARTKTARQIATPVGESSKNKQEEERPRISTKDFFKNLGKN